MNIWRQMGQTCRALVSLADGASLGRAKTLVDQKRYISYLRSFYDPADEVAVVC
jgi:hypothetical protein